MKRSTLRRPLFWAVLFILAICIFTLAACNDRPEDELPSTPDTGEVPTEPDDGTLESDIVEAPTEAPTEPEEVLTDMMIKETLDAPYAADFTVAKVFSSDMVVQRGEYIRVWGFADASENGHKVSGEFLGMFAEAMIENGAWELTFGARLKENADMGNRMCIYTDQKEVVFENVLVGDVYMVIGQSNVAYSVSAHLSVCTDPDRGGASSLDFTLPIRLHYNSLGQVAGYPKRGTEETVADLRNGSTWTVPNQGNIQNFSALGYYFATQLVKETGLNVPVGIIEIDGNGQPIGSFMSNEAATATGSDTWSDSKGYYTTRGCNGDAARYMYNHYMYPFERYALAGVVWYQGESDCETDMAMSFPAKFTALMTYMRSTHNLAAPEFPVYLVEFPSIYKYSSVSVVPQGQNWAFMDIGFIRGMLGSVPQMLSNSYLSVSCDLWGDKTYWNSLHPNCKYEQASRTAKLAATVRSGVYTMEQVVGPVLVSVELSDDKKTAILTYENVGDGLTTCDGGTAVKGFQTVRYSRSGAYNLSTSCTATITAPNQITVTAKTAFYGVAYNAVSDYYYGEQLNLCNSNGCPAGATVMVLPKEE